ncbi:hypothetical protein [Actinomadura miaoliensis]|uniref:Uncharacterized protein n=1 Tax=Actinomadura miaoliensis TaxID=430685 RepID=A0ABP7WSX6_9ACTN
MRSVLGLGELPPGGWWLDGLAGGGVDLPAQLGRVRGADQAVLSASVQCQRPVLASEVAVPARRLGEALPELGHFLVGVQNGHGPWGCGRYDTHETPPREDAACREILRVATGSAGLAQLFVGLPMD